MARREVPLQASQALPRPFRGRILAGRLFFDDAKAVLEADGFRKPCATFCERARKLKSRIPVPKMPAPLDADAGHKIGGAEAPAIVAGNRVQGEDPGAGMSVATAEAAGLCFDQPRRIHVEASVQVA